MGNLDFNLLSGRVNASDVLQEAFLDMAKELPAYRDKPDQHLIPWAWKDDQTSEEQKWFAEAREFQKREMDYFSMHVQKPTTPVFALADSPVGLAAWILEKFYIWSDHNGDLTSIYSMEDLATFVMM